MLVYISKSDTNLNVDWDAMPDNAKAYIINYGLRQKLNDAGASATVKELGSDAGAQALAMAESVLEALMRGDISVRQAAKSQTLEEKVFTRVLRTLFKSQTGRVVSKEADTSNEALLGILAKTLGKPVDAITRAVQKRADAEILIERQSIELPSIEL
jgi:hypothetical protein